MLKFDNNHNNKSTALVVTAATTAAVILGYYLYQNNFNNKNNHNKKKTMTTTTTEGGKCPFHFDAVQSYPKAATTSKDGSHITNLSNPRSSEGMGLPAALSQKTIDMIVATAPAVAPHMLNITKQFYGKILPKHPELLQFFNPAHNVPNSDHQPKALAGSCIAYATNITDLTPLLVPGGPVAAICHRHCALAIFPGQYVVVHANLMEAIVDILGDVVTPDIGAAWSEAVLFLAKAMIDTEESLYQMAEQRSGGWSGFAEFEVSDIIPRTSDVKQICFKPPAGSTLEGSKFEFTPGQYLSLQIDMESDNQSAPRHYTVTSPVDADYLSCTIKKHSHGKLSTYVHEELQVGDKVTLSAPFGVFTEPEEEHTSTVLLSAGIGITPMINLYKSKNTKVKAVVHVDKTPDTHPYREYFEQEFSSTDTPFEKIYKYTKDNGRVSAKDLIAEVLDKVGKDHDFLICGPEQWMDDLQKELLANGARRVMCEVFGSQLATGCPFFAG